MDLLSPEPLPAGLDPSLLDEIDAVDNTADLYDMAAAVTALTQEVRLQGRAFKQVADAVAPLSTGVDALIDAVSPVVDRIDRLAARNDEGASRLLDALLDVRDRLLRGRETARAAAVPPRSWLSFLRPRPAPGVADALLEGYDLALQRLDATLEELQVREIPALGQPFDAQRMRAVAVEETDRAEHGTVLEVFRAGYALRGQVHRSADVKVARPPAAGKA